MKLRVGRQVAAGLATCVRPVPVALTAALVLTLSAAPPALSAQDAASLATLCASAGTAGIGRCAEASVAARALRSQVGILAGLGSEIAGSASTLGRKFGTSLRIALSLRTGFARMALPDHTAPSYPAQKATFSVPTIHVGLAVGVFDGFSLQPTVGGFLSLDVMVQTSLVLLPRDSGFEDKVAAFSYGLRVGIIKESFTLPGIAVSASRRSVGDIALGSVVQGDAFQVRLDPTVTSLRATVGKDVLSVGVLAGVGWDSHGGGVTVGTGDATATLDDFGEDRMLYFGGASLNFLILQISAEGGWAAGFAPVTGYGPAPYDPGSGTYFGSVAFRLTL